jgi:hypothetical protein
MMLADDLGDGATGYLIERALDEARSHAPLYFNGTRLHNGRARFPVRSCRLWVQF